MGHQNLSFPPVYAIGSHISTLKQPNSFFHDIGKIASLDMLQKRVHTRRKCYFLKKRERADDITQKSDLAVPDY